MGREDLYISVPSFFRCPISLDVMKSPVILCTGVTYDRSSIQQWLDGGNDTCPATMQLLTTKDLVPNHTLHRLIRIWSDSLTAGRSSPEDSPASPGSDPPWVLTHDHAQDLADHILRTKRNSSEPISKLLSFARDSNQNRKFLASMDWLIPFLIGIVADQSNFTLVNLQFVEEVVMLLQLILSECSERTGEQMRKLVAEKKDDASSSMLFILQRGNLSSRIATARILKLVAVNAESKLYFAEKCDLLPELFKLVGSETDPDAVEAGLSGLICLAMPKRIRVRLVRLGAVKLFGRMLAETNLSVVVNEKLLKLLEMASSCREGWAEICEDGVCVPAIVKKVLKVSAAATEHAVTILWSVCYLLRDGAAQEAVARSNGLTKILLLMQSNCSPGVRKMCGDLLKIFLVSSKSSCLSSYETKTTHIMPF